MEERCAPTAHGVEDLAAAAAYDVVRIKEDLEVPDGLVDHQEEVALVGELARPRDVGRP